ncbi:LysM peptidoglycan-binding domain-containing protein [Lachnospiraceae bacterium OM04-12BH]|nr:LysM peptidoglycan-binding domain-containing protein [Lachnospiraceae bacterium OM04-12BH]
MKKRIVSLTMVLALCLMLLPTSAFAAEDSGAAIGTGGLCAHHTEHDDTCGYVEGIAESPCTHEHSEDCYTEVTSCTHEHTGECYPASDSSIPEDGTTSSEDESVEDTMPSDDESGKDTTLPEDAEPTACSHVCSVESGCIKQELDCKHEHDEECGYAPAVEGQPCTYVCTLCGMTEITAWSFVDTQEVLDPDSGVLALSASAESPVLYEDIVDLLPTEIEATTENSTETLSLDSWSCDDYPDEGAYTGSYTFHAVLPEGYGLAADAPALTVTVELDDEVMLMAEGQHSHCICGASHRDIGEHKGEASVSFDKKLSCSSSDTWLQVDNNSAGKTTIDNRTYWVLPAGSYYLAGDITLDKSILIESGEVNICLNGHKLRLNHGTVQIWEVIQLNGGTLNLTDCQDKGTVCHVDGNPGRGVTVGNGTSFTLYGGTICNNVARVSSTKAQGGVYIGIGSTFNMYGGKIHNNRAEDSNEPTYEFWGGGGVYCAPKGTFNLLAGEITENQVRVTKDGGNGFGGGVFNQGTFTMSGNSKISKNFITCSSPRGQYGGGVCNYKNDYCYATFKMNGGEISGNYIDSWNGGPAYGGGVYNNKIFKFTGGTITGNRVQSAQMNVFGGGIYNDQGGEFTMSGGAISGNQALTYTSSASNNSIDGGGIYFTSGTTGNFTLSGGTITGNTAKGKGAGIFIYDYDKYDQTYFHLSGNPVVWDNKTDNKQCNLYMYYRYDLKSPLTPDAKVGLSLKEVNNNNVMVNVGSGITEDMSQYFASDDSAFKLETSGSTIIRTPAHTHSWEFTKKDGNNSKIFVTCKGTIGTCDYKNDQATVSISTDQTVYDCALIKEAPKAVLTYSNNWPDGLTKAQESAIEYYKSTDGGSSYTVLVTDNNDLKKPGKYLAQIALVKNRYLETCFSVVDNRKTDPKYTAPTPKRGLTYNGEEQKLINPGHVEGGDMLYKLENGTYSTELPTATNAGRYTVYYKVVGDATHNDTAEQSITVTIGKAPLTGTPTFTPVTEAGKTIGDVTPTVTHPVGWPNGAFGWIGEGGAYLALNTPIKQGASYEWFFKPADRNNYQCSSGKLVLWAGTSGGSSSNPGGGNSSNTSGGSNTGGSSSDDGNTSDIGNSNNGSSNANIPPTPVTVPVSGDEKTIQVDAVVSGNTATIKNVDLSKLDTVIEDTAKNGVVTIDFSVLKKVDNVKLPSNVVKQIAEAVNEPDNDAKDLEIVLANGTSIKLDAKMLGEKNVKANGADITISIKRITGSSLNIKQKQAVGSRPALDINVTIGGKPISDMNGKVTISAAYELKPGEHASGIVVSYVDANGNRQLCETSYDPIRKQVSWKIGSFSPSSVYMIGYDESRVHAYVTYTVQKGSTLSMIAKKHGCTVADIMAANSGLIKNPNRIFVGWQLKIPQD